MGWTPAEAIFASANGGCQLSKDMECGVGGLVIDGMMEDQSKSVSTYGAERSLAAVQKTYNNA